MALLARLAQDISTPLKRLTPLTRNLLLRRPLDCNSWPASVQASTVIASDFLPFARILLFGSACAGGLIANSKSKSAPVKCSSSDREVAQLLCKMTVVPFGVLGSRLLKDKSVIQASTMPDAKTVIVDSGGHQVLNPGGPRRAGGAAKSIYKWIGISNDDGFPPAVVAELRENGHAKYHDYGQGRHVIHAFGPDLRKIPDSWDDAVNVLAETYCSIFREFVKSGLPVLRLLPVSGGIFAGQYMARMPELTVSALKQGLAQLPPETRNTLLQERRLELCIFLDMDHESFESALRAA